MLFNKQNGNSNSVYPLVLSWCNEVMVRNTGFGAVHAGKLGATKMSVLFYSQPIINFSWLTGGCLPCPQVLADICSTNHFLCYVCFLLEGSMWAVFMWVTLSQVLTISRRQLSTSDRKSQWSGSKENKRVLTSPGCTLRLLPFSFLKQSLAVAQASLELTVFLSQSPQC